MSKKTKAKLLVQKINEWKFCFCFAFIMVVFWGKCPNLIWYFIMEYQNNDIIRFMTLFYNYFFPNLIWYFIMEYQNNDIIRFMTLFYNYFFLKTTWIQVFDCDTIKFLTVILLIILLNFKYC
ncbi:hypothetical protein DXA97_06970 [Clostridium sp. OF09-36]|nr:hypothetical protein DXA97_06970 [Clostridium sp. OF09-36]